MTEIPEHCSTSQGAREKSAARGPAARRDAPRGAVVAGGRRRSTDPAHLSAQPRARSKPTAEDGGARGGGAARGRRRRQVGAVSPPRAGVGRARCRSRWNTQRLLTVGKTVVRSQAAPVAGAVEQHSWPRVPDALACTAVTFLFSVGQRRCSKANPNQTPKPSKRSGTSSAAELLTISIHGRRCDDPGRRHHRPDLLRTRQEPSNSRGRKFAIS